MSEPNWSRAYKLYHNGDAEASLQIIRGELELTPSDPEALFVFGHILFNNGKFEDAVTALTMSVEGNPANIQACFELALSHKRLTTIKDLAKARDILLHLNKVQPDNLLILREAAECCGCVGPIDKSIELWRKLIELSPDADAYFQISEILAYADHLEEAEKYLRMAIQLAPERYGRSVEDLKVVESARIKEKGKSAVVKKGRYPETETIQGELKKTILEYVAADLKDAPKFITKDTVFFTMGSCFANNVVRALSKSGYNAQTIYTPEVINTTYANRYFADWLEGVLPPGPLADRICEMLPSDFCKELVIERLTRCDVFIITLGVAPAFFDRETGEFVMPRPTALNSRALGEKYLFRTTSVSENVGNVLHLLSYIHRLNPGVKVVVTESPVPLHMTFEFRSAVAADCLSKSTLRVAAHEIVHNSGLKNIYYWPSFEIFRWLGSHLAMPVYGVDDGAAWHVSEDMVNLTMNCFIEAFTTA